MGSGRAGVVLSSFAKFYCWVLIRVGVYDFFWPVVTCKDKFLMQLGIVRLAIAGISS